MLMGCDYHGDELTPNGGPSKPCGICGLMLFQRTLMNECQACGFLIGVIQTRKWIGDAWVVDPADAAEVEPAVKAHLAECPSDNKEQTP